MKQGLNILVTLLLPIFTFAQEKGHGHTHGSGGESEHLLPILSVFAALIVVGAIVYFMNKKKK